MSSTVEVMDAYSTVCLPETTISSSSSSSDCRQSSSTPEKEIKDGSVNVDGSNKLAFGSDLFSESRESSFDGFSNHNSKSSVEDIVEKVDVSIGVDFSFNLLLIKLADLDQSLKIEQEKNILLNNKLNKLEYKYNNKLNNINSDIDDLYEDLNSVDSKVLQLDQYTRRESIVISGIDKNITQNNLEYTVLRILRTIGLFNVSSYEITACHRLFNKNNKYPPRTIVRFTNRKIVEFCMSNRDKLNEFRRDLNMNLRFFEHLTDSNESVLKECAQLAKYEIIDSYFIRNGHVKIVINDGDKPIKINHTGILLDRFKEYYDYHHLEYMP